METMTSSTVTVRNDVGLHARPAALLVRCAAGFDATVTLAKDGREASASSLLSVLALDVRAGDEVTVSAVGAQAVDAVQAVVALIEDLAAP